jgi:hypothetical protein
LIAIFLLVPETRGAIRMAQNQGVDDADLGRL